MKRFFDENMTSSEARRVLFVAVEGKTEAEIEQIKKEYTSVSAIIIRRELEHNKGWMTSDRV